MSKSKLLLLTTALIISILAYVGGKNLYPTTRYDEIERIQMEKIFAEKYLNQIQMSQGEKNLMADLKSYYNQNPSDEVINRLKHPYSTYPLGEGEEDIVSYPAVSADLRDFVFSSVDSGERVIGQYRYNCYLSGSVLSIDGQDMKQSDYRIIASEDENHKICANLVNKKISSVTDKTIRLISRIESGTFVPEEIPEDTNPKWASFFFATPTWWAYLYKPFVFIILFMSIFIVLGITTNFTLSTLKSYYASIRESKNKTLNSEQAVMYEAPAKSLFDNSEDDS